MVFYATKEADPSTGLIRSWNHGKFQVWLYQWGGNDTILSELKVRAADINNSVFGMNPLQTANELRHHMKLGSNSASILFATADGKDVGFYIRREIKVPLQDGSIEKVSFTALREVIQNYQRRGIGTALLVDGHNELIARSAVKYYGGRTQDEIVIQSNRRSDLFDFIWAIDGNYESGSPAQQIMWRIAHVAIYAENAPADITTGLVIGAYPEGERGGYVLDLSHPGIREIHERFKELGLNEEGKKKGDATIYVARVKQQLVLEQVDLL